MTALSFWLIINDILTVLEKKANLPLGATVEIYGKEMHVYSKGNGDKTILLMSGLGTTAPVLDFEPLIEKLSQNYKVAVVENFGYGWSDTTDRDRTVENIIDETRTALNKAGITGPYILMPHSISGIYSMYYANKYPDEVEGIIGIDCTLPKQCEYFGEAYPKMSKLMSCIAPAGIARIAMYFWPEEFLPIAAAGTYSDKNLKLTKVLSAWNGYNKNIVSEMNEIENNMKKNNRHFIFFRFACFNVYKRKLKNRRGWKNLCLLL